MRNEEIRLRNEEIPQDYTSDLPQQQDVRDPARRWTFASPAPVYDVNERQIGVLNLGSPADYLIIERADSGPELYVPLSAVNRSDESGIYLSLSQADLADPRWQSPPPGARQQS
jgi:hypothetical protein